MGELVFDHSFHSCWNILLQSFTLPLDDYMPLLVQQFRQLCLMVCDHPSSSESHSRGFQWGSGLQTELSLDQAVFHSPLGSQCCVSWSVVLVGGYCQDRRKQDNLVHSWINAPFIKRNLTDPSIAEAPPDHHPSSKRIHSGGETLELVGLSRSLSKH